MIINALIISSEITKGMKSVGNRSMLNIVDNMKIIDQQIHYLKSVHKHINITIATGYEHERVSAYLNKRYKNINILYNPEYKTTNEATNIAMYLQSKEDIDNLFIINGGILLKKHSILHNIFKQQCSKIFLLNGSKPNFSLGCNKSANAEYIFYDLEQPWSECIFLTQNHIEICKNIISSNVVHQMFAFELINKLLHHQPINITTINKTQIMKISNINDLNKAKNFI